MNFIWPFILGVAFGWFMAACFHIWYYEDHLSYKPPAAIQDEYFGGLKITDLHREIMKEIPDDSQER